MFLSDNSIAYEDSPIHAFFADVFGLNYFLFMIPIAVAALYFVILLGDWLINKIDKKTNINGKNYIAVIVILITFPNVLINEILFALSGRNIPGLGFRGSLIAGLVLMAIYIILAEIDDKAYKRKI
jgi:hypothetical protein